MEGNESETRAVKRNQDDRKEENDDTAGPSPEEVYNK